LDSFEEAKYKIFNTSYFIRKIHEVRGDSFSSILIIGAGLDLKREVTLDDLNITELAFLETSSLLNINIKESFLEMLRVVYKYQFDAMCQRLKNNEITSIDLTGQEYSLNKDFFESLRHNKSLTSLELKGTGLDNDGLKLLISEINEKNVINYLGLSSNNININGFSSLVNLLENSETLCNINIYGNNVGKYQEKIDNLISINKGIFYLFK
jgi:hypothetical protein